MSSLAVLSAVIALTACGGAEPLAPAPAPQPLQVDAAPHVATTAAPLPAPALAQAPTQRAFPGAPAEAPLPAPLAKAPGRAQPAADTVSVRQREPAAASLRTLPAASVLRQAVVSGLQAPTDLAFSTDGLMFFTERTRGLLVKRPDASAAILFSPKDMNVAGSGGMLAVAVDPDFAHNRYVYLLMTSSQGGRRENRVLRLALDATAGKVAERLDIVSGIAASADSVSTQPARDARGSLRFGPDGFLYVGLGDARSPTAPQAADQLAGKILRIARDGKAAPGNRPPVGVDPRVFAFGFRSPVGMAFHTDAERLLVAERRGEAADRIVMASAGGNAGWDPRCAGQRIGYCEREADQVGPASPARPLLSTGSASVAWRGAKARDGLSALAQARSAIWKDWRGSLIAAFDAGQSLDLIRLDRDGRVVQTARLLDKLGVGFSALAEGPDGLYVATSGRPGGEEVWRLLIQ